MDQLGHKDQEPKSTLTLTLPIMLVDIMLVEFRKKLSYATQDMKMHTLARWYGLDAQR